VPSDATSTAYRRAFQQSTKTVGDLRLIFDHEECATVAAFRRVACTPRCMKIL